MNLYQVAFTIEGPGKPEDDIEIIKVVSAIDPAGAESMARKPHGELWEGVESGARIYRRSRGLGREDKQRRQERLKPAWTRRSAKHLKEKDHEC